MNPPYIPPAMANTPSKTSDLFVLITNASTHLGFRILVFALEAKNRVLATVGQPEEARKIASKPSVLPYRNQLTFVFVKDMTAPEAAERSMKGVTHIIHNSSPNAPPTPHHVGICYVAMPSGREIQLTHLAVDHGPALLRPSAQVYDGSLGNSKQNPKCSPRRNHLKRHHTGAERKRVWRRT